MHLSAACSSLRVMLVPSLHDGLISRYDLERNLIEIASDLVPSERPRAAAGAIIRIELDRILRHRPVAEREAIAGQLAPVMARFAQECEQNGGMTAWFRGEAKRDDLLRWRGLLNGSQRVGRPCANPTCDMLCAPGSVHYRDAEDVGGVQACRVATDCEACGWWWYWEVANGAGKPSGELLPGTMPEPMPASERVKLVEQTGVVGTIYV